jgi:DNA-binding response OmpR family regulator
MVDILVVGSDEKMVSQIQLTMMAEGMTAVTVEPQDALPRLGEESADLVVLNVDGNPGKALRLCEEIRDQTTAPLLLLTPDDQELTLARGLERGADACIVKPFSTRVFLAHVYALLRRIGLSKPGHSGQLEANGLAISARRREVSVYGRPVKLTPTESKLLTVLVQNSGRALSYRSLVKRVQGYDCSRQEARDIVKVHVHNLRRKIEPQLDNPRFILTVRDFGYMFERRRRDRH